MNRKKIIVIMSIIFAIFCFVSCNSNANGKNINEIEKTNENSSEISLMMVGDNLIHNPVDESGLQKDGSYNFDYLYKYIKDDVQEADISIINQETILGGEEYGFGITGYHSFNSRHEVGDALVKSGFNVILSASNHALDRGGIGILRTLKYWREKHPEVKVVGLYNSKKAQENITYYKKNGIKVAILNYTQFINSFKISEHYMINMMNEEKVSRDIAKAKKEKADFIIVCPHWGTEYDTGIDRYQKKWTKFFLKQGVDLVIGAHPHVIEPVKWAEDKDNKMLVYYSLGDYTCAFGTTKKKGCANMFYGGMAKVTIKKSNLENEKGKNTYINSSKFVPLIVHKARNGKITTYKVSDYTKDMANKNQVIKNDYTFSYESMREFYKKIIDKEFLEEY